MGEVLSKDTIDLLNHPQVKDAVRSFIESDRAPAAVSIKSAESEADIRVTFRIAST